MDPDAADTDLAERKETLRKIEEAVIRLERMLERVSKGTSSDNPVTRLRNEIASRWGESARDINLKALTLYKAALEAEDEGHHLAVINKDDEIVRDITEVRPGRATEP